MISIWGLGKNVSKIGKYQKWAIRTIFCLKYNAHTTWYFKKYGLLKFEDLRDWVILTLARTFIAGNKPKAYSHFLTYLSTTHPRKHHFSQPFPDSQIIRLPQHIIPNIWNNNLNIINEVYEENQTIKSFQNKLKKKLI